VPSSFNCSHHGQLKGDSKGVTHNVGTDLDQPELKAGQLPFGHSLGQLDPAQEGDEVVGQRAQFQPHRFVAEPRANKGASNERRICPP
jgi:hypothetical protein